MPGWVVAGKPLYFKTAINISGGKTNDKIRKEQSYSNSCWADFFSYCSNDFSNVVDSM